jgi:glycosyltransferase involved in cell wall biosynthesis
MARHLADRYGIAPHVVYNVFPRAEADRLPPPWQRRRRDTIELVWLSATIGGGRGLDDAVCALAKLPAHVRLTIVGRMLPGYEPRLRALVADAGVGSRVSQHPPVAPCAIFAALGGFDVGLALERDDSANRRLTITNKLFQYLQAGLLVAATGTDGQREVLDAEPAIGFVYPPGDVDALAARLMTYVTNRQALARAQAAAWDAGRARYCWERTSGVLLDAVAAAGIRPTPAPAIAAS